MSGYTPVLPTPTPPPCEGPWRWTDGVVECLTTPLAQTGVDMAPVAYTAFVGVLLVGLGIQQVLMRRKARS